MAVKTGSKRATSGAARTAGKARAESRHWFDVVEDHFPRPIRAIVSRARKDQILLYSAALAFYASVSIVPLVILILSLASLVLGDQRVHQLAEQVGRLAPKSLGADQWVRKIGELATQTSVVAFLTGLWPATSYGAGLVRAFDAISPRKDRELQGFRGRGLTLLILLPFFVLGGLIGSYAGTQVVGDSTLSQIAGAVIALATGFLGAAGGIALIYWIFPPERLTAHQILVATATTAGALTFLSLALTLYVGLGASFEHHYATSGLAILVLLAVWLFLANALMLVGYKLALETKRS